MQGTSPVWGMDGATTVDGGTLCKIPGRVCDGSLSMGLTVEASTLGIRPGGSWPTFIVVIDKESDGSGREFGVLFKFKRYDYDAPGTNRQVIGGYYESDAYHRLQVFND